MRRQKKDKLKSHFSFKRSYPMGPVSSPDMDGVLEGPMGRHPRPIRVRLRARSRISHARACMSSHIAYPRERPSGLSAQVMGERVIPLVS
jgi:hypothetical protein